MKLDYKQLAFILNIEPKEALEKILYVHSKVTGKDLPAHQDMNCGRTLCPTVIT